MWREERDVAFTKTLRIVERDKARNKELSLATRNGHQPSSRFGKPRATAPLPNIHSQCIHATGRTTNFM
ncbi:hypothetical protein BC936DRAFT_148152 [Jimgerdemannia flammicorona]|uniref:Uncharacterized protein n=1 Tax=Jimgerdemannia flammicorona TaxID=994334 RepID=A0A433DKK6_9FUNG|nr:hypothetical protein BC936DRAFT_148152 [Jimgerdemannia flammicorona]